MIRRLVPLALLLVGALGLATWITGGGSDLEIDHVAGLDVIRVGPGGEPALGESDGEAATVGAGPPASAQRLVASPTTPKMKDAPAPRPDVAGVLTTVDGRPIGGALVRLTFTRQEGGPSELSSFLRRERHARDARTDARGIFLFEGVARTVKEGTFLYGGDLVLGSPVSHPLDPEADWQILRLPEFAPQPALARIDVVSELGRPLEIEAVDLEFRGPTPSVRVPKPTTADRTVEPGRVTLHALVPGKWFVWIAVDGGGEGGLEFEIQKPDEAAHLTLVLPWFEGAADTTVVAASPPEEKLWIDATTGIHDWLPEDTLALGEADSDRYFAHTLRLGHGPVSAATLTIRMRSINGMSTNDAILLEHIGKREFRWRTRIADLVTGGWRGGDQRTLRLDLARLPTPEGSVSLLPDLEDGLLDVVVQDDTAIESLSLRIVR